jgi:hypothetical protein
VSKLAQGVQKVAAGHELAAVSHIDAELALAGGDITKLAVLDRVVAYVARYGQSHRDRLDATKAKLKIARQGGAAIIEAQEHGQLARQGQQISRDGISGLKDYGLTLNRSSRWQAVAKLPENDFADRLAAVDAEDEDASLAAQTMGGLKAQGIVEWYTPARYPDAERDVTGGIDLGPASSVLANKTIRATAIFTREDDGLAHDWWGRVWLNPPYGVDSGLFTSKLVAEYRAGRVTAAVLLLNAYGFDNDWFQPLWEWPICFTDHRIQFTSPQRESGGPANGNIFVYLGPDPEKFARRFREFGTVVRACTL